jgi:hypothetical protein
VRAVHYNHACIDKKENQTFLIYKEIQMGSGAKSYMWKGFLIYEEMRKFFPIYEEAVSHICMTLNPIPLNCHIYEENFILFFISVKKINKCSFFLSFLFRLVYCLFRFNRSMETLCFGIEAKQPKQTFCFG